MHEFDAAQSWVFDELNDATINALLADPADDFDQAVYSGTAPQNAVYPFIVVQSIPGLEDFTSHGGSALSGALFTFQVRANWKDKCILGVIDDKRLADIMTACDTLLHGKNVTSGAFKITSDRVAVIPIPPSLEGGKEYRQLAHHYRVIVRLA